MKKIIFILLLNIFSVNIFARGYATVEEAIKADYKYIYKTYFNCINATSEDENLILDLLYSREPSKIYSLSKVLSDKGYSIGYYWLGWCYEGGEGVKMDLNKAFECFYKAATCSCPFEFSYDKIASYYYEGWGIQKDLHKSYEWSKKGSQTIPNNRFRGGCLYRMVSVLIDQNDLTPSIINEIYSLMTQANTYLDPINNVDNCWVGYGSHLDAIYKNNMYQLGLLILEYDIKGETKKNGIKLIQKSASLGQADAQFYYGIYLINNKDVNNGKLWIEKAANNGSMDAIRYLFTNQ